MRMERGQSVTTEESSQETPETTTPTPPVTTQYYSVMEDKCPDEIFRPPSLAFHFKPEEGSTCEAAATDPSVSLRSFDDTKANINPECLDWNHGEKQLMTSPNQVNEEMENALPTFEEVVRSDYSSKIQCMGQEQGQLEDRLRIQECGHSTEGEVKEYKNDGVPEDKMLDEQDQELKLVKTNLLDKTGLNHPSQNTERFNTASVDTEDNQNTRKVTLTQSQDNSHKEGTDSALEVALNSDLTDYDWVKRTGVQDDEEDLSTENRGLDEQEESAGIMSDSRLASEILQGENLLQRLQLVQQRQDLDEICLQTPKLEEDRKTNVAPETIQEFQEGSDQTQTGPRLLIMTAPFEHCIIHKTETVHCNKENDTQEKTYSHNEGDKQEEEEDYRDADYTDGIWKFNDENRIPFPPDHRRSAAETFMEKQFQETSQIKQDLQRAEGVFDLTENPDVLEIPFKTDICLEPTPTIEDSGAIVEWHFSEQKMQKDISQDMQKEMVLVNLGKIPGGYSKRESRQMKDTRLLFEAFQQVKVEGPTKISKPLDSLPRPVYPTVLEQTRSLEMFSQKNSASKKEKYTETFRPLSPSIRDKPHLSPYPKHKKDTCMHKSMDSISTSPTSTGGRKSKQEPTREGSPLLKENPFFKLRPALSLQPEVEKDIREAKKREEELHKQRSSLYGEMRQGSKEEGMSTAELKADPTLKTTGRLERVWPPPSKKEPTKAEQQEVKARRGHKASLWQRWESGFINGQPTNNNNNK